MKAEKKIMSAAARKWMRVLGIMSGTSMDGVDYALCAIREGEVRLLDLWHAEFPAGLRRSLHAAARGELKTHPLGQLHHDLGRFYARHARGGGRKARPHWIGVHGQTVYHQPNGRRPATWQLGEPAYLAEAFRTPVVSNFRVADLVAGGQGAPLATLFHRVVFAERGRHRAVNNLGGISNVTSMDWRKGREPTVLAFDTGPANVLIDMAARHYSRGRLNMDRDGAWASRGRAAGWLLERWLRHPFFRRPPPKSTGRELFGEPFWRRALAEARAGRLGAADTLATLTTFTARSIALNYRWHLREIPDEVILTGGGAENPVLAEEIRAALSVFRADVRVRTSAQMGWPSSSIEPAAFALLAWRRMMGLPGNLPATTGARRAVQLGQVSECNSRA